MRFTFPWLAALGMASETSQSGCYIHPEGEGGAGVGGGSGSGGTQPPAAAPPVAAPLPAPSTLQPVVPPGGTQPGAVPVVPPVVPAQPAAPTPAQPAAGRALTQADLDANNAKLLEQIQVMVRGGQQQPAASAPAAPPAAAQPAAPTPAQPAAPTPAQPGVDPLRQAAMETELRDLKAREAANTQTLERIQRERADAEARASFAQNQTAVREALEGNVTYRVSAHAAKEATDKMFYKNMIRRGDDGNLWVVLPDTNGQPATYSLKDGVTKFLESPEGQFFRPATPPGLGTNPSTPGRPPVSLPGASPASNSVPAASGIEGALTFQRALEQQQQITRNGPPQ